MQISPISMCGTTPTFTMQPQVQTQPQKTGGGVGKAVLSVVPGLGQVCDGRVSTGLKFMGGVVGAYVASKALPFLSLAIATSVKNPKVAGWGCLLSGITALALKLASIGLYAANFVDAYQGKKA